MSNTTSNLTNRLATAFMLLIAVIAFQNNVPQENTAQELRITIAEQVIEEPGIREIPSP